MYEPKSPYTQSNRIQRIVYIPAILFTILLIPTLLVFATSGKINPQAPSRIAPKPQSTINVNTTDDELVDDGYCSLREALTAANTDAAVDNCSAGSGDDEIQLPAGYYTLSIWGMGDDDNLTGDLDVLQNVSISGADSRNTTIDGGALDSVFHILSGASLELRDVTIENEGASLSPESAIRNYGDLNIHDAIFQDNIANSNGAAIYSEGSMYIANTTFLDNFSDINGGAIYLRYGETTIVNSTISGNATDGDGGGILNNFATLHLNNVTITDNLADEDEADWGDGGGLAVIGGTTDFSNTIIAGNLDAVVISGGSDGEIAFTRKPPGDGYLLSTNFNLATNEGPVDFRWETSSSMLDDLASGLALTPYYAGDILDAVHLNHLTTYTLYSSVLELRNNKVYLFYMSQFDEMVEIDMEEEFAKGERVVDMRDFFSSKTVTTGDAAYQKFENRFKAAQIGVITVGVLLLGGVITLVVRFVKRP